MTMAEFLGFEFQELLDSHGICGQPTTVENLVAKGLIEQVHLTIRDQLQMITSKVRIFMLNLIISSKPLRGQLV